MADIARASSAAEVLEAVAWAAAEGKRLAVRGGGSKAAIGRPAPADVVTLDLAGLSGVIAYEPAELVLTALAGTPLAEIEALLAASGQQLAFEPMDYGPLLGGPANAATLGGTIAANVSGPRRIKDGAARDHFLGFHAVSGRGEAFKAGGKVVKNVTGYDLSKLMAGSWGTLAVLTEVTLKVLPAPRTSASVIVTGLDPQTATWAMSRALGSPADVSGAAHLPPAIAVKAGFSGAATVLRLEGFGPSVEARARTVRQALASFGESRMMEDEESRALWAFVRDARAFVGDARPLWRISAPPMAGPAILAAIQARTGCDGFLDWGGGLVWAAIEEAPDAGAAVVRAVAEAHAGQAMLVRAPAAARAAVEPFPPEPAGLAALSAKVKAGFDPLGVLNPGRMRPEPRS